MSEPEASSHCPYCDMDRPHHHDISQDELELMRGCQRSFELLLRRFVCGPVPHSHYMLHNHRFVRTGHAWSMEPRQARDTPHAWNRREGPGSPLYIDKDIEALYDLWRYAWRAARSASAGKPRRFR